jgi:hypothetical protein
MTSRLNVLRRALSRETYTCPAIYREKAEPILESLLYMKYPTLTTTTILTNRTLHQSAFFLAISIIMIMGIAPGVWTF